MQIKRFEARNMSEAFRDIKDEFGPDAVILSTRTLNVRRRLLDGKSAPRVEVTAARDNYIESQRNATSRQYAVDQYSQKENPITQIDEEKRNSIIKNLSGRLKPIKNFKLLKNKSENDIIDEDKSIKNLKNHLLDHGIDEDIVNDIIERLIENQKSKKYSHTTDIRSHLANIFDRIGIETVGKSKVNKKGSIIGLVGLTGIGKTTTLVKLAASEVLTSNKKVGVISLDTDRIAANLMLDVFAKIIGFKVECVTQPSDVKHVLRNMSNMDVIFVDTPGISLNDDELRYKIKSLMDKIGVNEIHLVLNSNTKRSDSDEILRKFNVFGYHCLLFTKLDETSGFGTIINQLFDAQRPISYVTYGQSIPEDINRIELETLVNLLMDSSAKKHRLFSKKFSSSQEIVQQGLYGISYN